MHHIYNTIKRIRLEKHFSQAYVAEKLSMFQGNYTKLENGKIQITIERLEKIAEVFGMTVLELLAGHEQGTQKKVDLETLEKRILELERELDLEKREKNVIGNERAFLEHEIENSIFLLEYCIEVLSEHQNDFKRENLINLLKSYIKDHEKAYKPMSSWFKELKKMAKNFDPDSKDVEK